ncbi:phosphatidylinositol 4,5-bisphosphate 5-phosphatase A isoform X2 [Hemicordylus capensis]|uniref:phosphatidylinositol 4,5-bisphosphate 5-phosphatase A isoform X2 n=1 Tax=Hemicordylus capensis TaxID=884348 RepID=UPI0023046791|nr:phosphatidylinositol 4,5-bisphosphate 5-phosphatase A isoform X2 [Hemicordylus capensis]
MESDSSLSEDDSDSSQSEWLQFSVTIGRFAVVSESEERRETEERDPPASRFQACCIRVREGCPQPPGESGRGDLEHDASLSEERSEIEQAGQPQMEPGHHGHLDQGPSSPIGAQPVSPRGSITGLASLGAFSPVAHPFHPDGTARYQAEGSNTSVGAAFAGGNLPRGARPDALFDVFHARSQPEGSRHAGAEERALSRPNQPLSLEINRAQSESSGGVQLFAVPSLRSPVEVRPLSPASGSSSSLSSASPSMKLSQSPSRGMIPELCALDPVTSGILATVELKDSLPKAESSDHICLSRSGPPHRPMSLPKAVSSEYISGGRALSSKPSLLTKAESEELVSYGRVGHSPKSQDSGGNMNAKESFLVRFSRPQSKQEQEFRITVVTWNVGTAMPPSDVTSLLHLNTGDSNDTDMIAIGLQEVNSMINKRLKDALFTDQWSEVFMDVLSPFNFVLVSTVRMQGVILMVFAKYYHLPFLQDIQTDCTRTGLGGYWGNKGGVSVRLSVFGHMLCFLNCHLPAHMEKSEQRKEDFTTILNLQQFEGPSANGILDHDVVFWFGDLNFRIESLDIRFVKYAIDNNILHQLWEKDQLNIAKSTWPILKGFQEGLLNFPPTFKFDVGTNMYDTSAKKRKPAWTDRILWKIKGSGVPTHPGRPGGGGVSVTQLCYRSHMEYTVSDHKPVVSIFALLFSSRADVPLVELQVADEWTKIEQAVVRYKISVSYHRSSWDWIALYRVGFRHYKDYVAYVWAKQEDTESNIYQLMIPEESLPKGKGEYILGYYSNSYNSMVGVTEPFQISLPNLEQVSSPTDSSTATSEEEDDSTMVLLGPKSRSPSPGKLKRHRSRSPGLAKFQGLILRSPSREQGPSRSPSPQGRRGSSLLKGEIPSIQFSKDSPRHRSKSRELSQSRESRASSRLQVAWRFDENPLARADPRNLGLLPAVRLETLDQVMGHRRESADQGLPPRRMSPTSPTAGLSALFSTSPQEGGLQEPPGHDNHSRDVGH